MKIIELKVYANKLKIMREENATVRMQLLDPSAIKRIGLSNNNLSLEQGDQSGMASYANKADLVIKFERRA